jgi:hypothetical protein
MANVVSRYFDGIVSANFKTTPDGQRLFFPWGIWGRGYVIASEDDYKRLHGQLKIFMIVALVVIIGTIAVGWYLAGIALAVALTAMQVLWGYVLTRSMQPSEERLTYRENEANVARTFGPGILKALLVVSLVFVALGLLMLIVMPRDWYFGLITIVFFGFCAVQFVRMLRARRQADQPTA